MNLLQDKWINVQRKNGEIEKIAPYQITDTFETNPIIEIVTPRPDFKGAMYQFLIGLFQTVCSPPSEEKWQDWFWEPPHPDELKKETDRVAFAFDLFGEKIRFMQDMNLYSENDEEKFKPIELLFIEAPDESKREKNLDFFVKKYQIQNTCGSCSALALITLQINAPEGGSGNYTSLRGGGPLTTLLKLDDEKHSLWQNIWINILSENYTKSKKSTGKNYEYVFPWVTDNYYKFKSHSKTTNQDLHFLSMYWSNSRRLYLNKLEENGKCDICSEHSDLLVNTYRAKNQGIDYGGGGWIHPLNPYYFKKDKELGDTWFPHHPQPGGIVYSNWQSFTYGKKGQEENAKVIKIYLEERKEEQLRVWTFGYDMKQMKSRCWYESTIPIYKIPIDYAVKFEYRISLIIGASVQVANNLQKFVKQAWKKEGNTDFLKTSFFKATESSFYNLAKNIRDNIQKEEPFDNDSKLNWLKYLNKESLKLFDLYVESGSIEFENIQRIVNARQKLISENIGDKMKERIGLHVEKKPKTTKGVKKK
ncbi:MAG: type I-E CRISPR-associated protein Cse1/CasA [Leptospiraceae bacterium]|nr:type I-E CRISPR-associated protein Cse1/CasA [Leptospiraceae bacterium]MCP5497271.1 type I-E CRISPR-associated protein Cse1/CasA [Leptospiraceae bacterium]